MNTLRPKISKRRLLIFSVFVLISAVFWFLSAMNQEYTTKISYKVSFVNFPEDVRPVSGVPDKLTLTVKGYGYDLIGKSKITAPLKIDVKKYALKDKNDKSKLILSTHLLSDKFFPNANGISIISVNPETIIFKTEKLKTKKVPVKANIDFSCKPLYMQSGDIKIIPERVTVSGSYKKIKEIKYVETKTYKFTDLEDTLKAKCKIKHIKGTKISEKEVLIIIPVEKYTEKSLNLPVSIINCPDSLNLITFPDNINLTYKVVLSKFETAKPDDFKITVDYNDINENNKDKLKVKITSKPKFIKSVQLSPEYVEYIIEKKQ